MALTKVSYSMITGAPINVLDYGADGTMAGDSAALKAAITAASASWSPVILPARRYYWDGTAISTNYVKLWGAGMPAVNAGKTALVGGTIIEGGLIFSGQYIDLRDFGVDLGTAGSATDSDGIKCTAATYNQGKYLYTENLVALCKNKTSVFHALLFEGYERHEGGNLLGVHGYFGCVLKQRNVQITTIETDTNNETGVYIKSDSTFGSASNIQIAAIYTKTATDFGVRVQSDSALLENVQIGQIHGSDHGRTICVQVLNFAGANIRNVNCGDILSERSGIADFSVLSQRSGSSVFDIGFESLTSIDPTAKVIEADNEAGAIINYLFGNRIYASYASGTSQATMDNAIFVDSGVNSTNFSNVEIVESFGVGSKIGAINYTNNANPLSNILTAHRCGVVGVGAPQQGKLSQTLSGSTATLLIPINATGETKSFAAITIAAPTTVTIFSAANTGNIFSPGHMLLIYNGSASTLTIANNFAGNIINSSGASVNIAANEVAAWVCIGSNVFSQLKIA